MPDDPTPATADSAANAPFERRPAPNRDRALTLLAEFSRRCMPGILRRIVRWKQLPPGALKELQADVMQELAIDCLEDPDRVLDSAPVERHQHWIRLAERWIYRQHVRSGKRTAPLDPDRLPEPSTVPSGSGAHGGPGPDLPGSQVDELPTARELAIGGQFVWLKNGRCNLSASAARTGQSIGAVQRQLDAVAQRLGDDGRTRRFWQRRLAEALLGLGVDLLRSRHRHDLVVLPPTPDAAGPSWPAVPVPDPGGRLLRVRRLCARFPHHRVPPAVRRAQATWNRATTPPAAPALVALEQATTLWPEHAAAWLWLFEARLIARDLTGTARALRTAHRVARAPRDRIVLARARLLEARGRTVAAHRLLARATHRRPGDGRLQRALALVETHAGR